jgi:hypothetical protein
MNTQYNSFLHLLKKNMLKIKKSLKSVKKAILIKMNYYHNAHS